MIAPDLLPLARPIASLREDPQNARKHDKRNLAAIAASLSEFGQRKPVVALADGTVIAGNGTLAAAKSLGWTEIAVATFEDEEKAKAYAIADNRAGELASWDDEMLAQTLSGIDESLRAACGFSSAELERLCKAAGGGGGDPDDVPEPPAEPTAKRGDLFVLGKHRLLCGDSTNADDVRRVLDGAQPRLLLTDPPYGVSLDMEWRDRAGLNGLGPAEASYLQRGDGHRNTAISGDTKADWSDAFELVPSLDTAYVWHASAYSVEVGSGLRRIGFELKQQIIWRKPHFVLSRQHYHWQHEPCWYARKDGAAKFRGSRDQSTIWDAASPKMLMNPAGEREEKVDHPTQKPVTLYTRPIENHLEPGEAFYEPFGGSGSAIAAAETTGRRCFAIELDPKYADVIVARWERLSGQKAEPEVRVKRVFVCSAYRGDVAANVELARAACREVLGSGAAPFAPHLLYPDLLDDADADERALGMAAGRAWLAASDEVLVVGPVSDGMRQEIDDALARGIPVRYAETTPAPPTAWQRVAAWIELHLPGAWRDRVVLAAIAFVVVAFLLCPAR